MSKSKQEIQAEEFARKKAADPLLAEARDILLSLNCGEGNVAQAANVPLNVIGCWLRGQVWPGEKYCPDIVKWYENVTIASLMSLSTLPHPEP